MKYHTAEKATIIGILNSVLVKMQKAKASKSPYKSESRMVLLISDNKEFVNILDFGLLSIKHTNNLGSI